ncbi:hypothetical protein ACJX0J_009953, partial [Zea mays]
LLQIFLTGLEDNHCVSIQLIQVEMVVVNLLIFFTDCCRVSDLHKKGSTTSIFHAIMHISIMLLGMHHLYMCMMDVSLILCTLHHVLPNDDGRYDAHIIDVIPKERFFNIEESLGLYSLRPNL